MLGQLRDIVEQVGKAKNLSEAMDKLVQLTKSNMHVDCCSIYLTDQKEARLNLIASKGLASQAVGKMHLNFEEGIVGLVHKKGEPLNLAHVSDHPHFKYLPSSQEELFNSFLGSPIIHKRQVLGVLVVQQKATRLFSEVEESFLVTLSMHLASVLANSNFLIEFEKVKKKASSIHLPGSPASPGIAVAEAYVVRPILTLKEVKIEKSHSVSKDLLLFEILQQKCTEEFSSLSLTLREQVSKDAFAIFDIYSHILNDPVFLGEIRDQINNSQLSAASAIKVVAESYIKKFEEMGNPYLSERASDIRDVAQRMLYHLTQQVDDEIHLPEKLVLVAKEVTLTMLASIPTDKLQGIVSVLGGVSSHVAILARALGIPAVMGTQLSLDNINRKVLIIDGYAGNTILFPDPPLLNHYRILVDEENDLKKLVESVPNKEVKTADGFPVSVLLNTGLSNNQHPSIGSHFDGIGLYRSELPFILTDSFPTEQEQIEFYQDLLDQYATLPVTMRTLDIGGDKKLNYFPIVEENPFLGWRGIRLTLDHPEIFLVQIRAMLKANLQHQNLRILLPMITSIEEVDEAKQLIIQAWNEIKYESGLTETDYPLPDIGVMIEVPSAMFIIPQIAQKVDFISIGSNDLTQYLLAVDRNNSRVASLYDGFHPAVLQSLKIIIDSCNNCNLEVSVCGELAGDPIGSLIIIALGCNKLSMSAYNMNKIKYLIHNSEAAELKNCIEQALKANSGKEIRIIFSDYLVSKGLGGFIRAGKY